MYGPADACRLALISSPTTPSFEKKHSLGTPTPRRERVPDEVAVLAVHRHEVARPRERASPPDPPGSRVPRRAERQTGSSRHLGTPPQQRVDHVVDDPLVAGDHPRRQDHEVTGARSCSVLVVATRSAGGAELRLPPGCRSTGGHLALGGQLGRCREQAETSPAAREIAELPPDRRLADMMLRPSSAAYPPCSATGRDVQHLLDAVECDAKVATRRRPREPTKPPRQLAGHLGLRRRSRPGRPTLVESERAPALPARRARRSARVGRPQVERRAVELEVARVDHGAERRLDTRPTRPSSTMECVMWIGLHLNGRSRDGRPGLEAFEVGELEQAVLGRAGPRRAPASNGVPKTGTDELPQADTGARPRGPRARG